MENLRFDNFVIEGATVDAIEITTLYRSQPEEAFSERTPVFRNFAFSNLTITHARQVASIQGLPEKAIEQLRFSDITATGSAGFLCDHSLDIELHNVRVDATSGSAFVFDRVNALELDGVGTQAPQASLPVLDLRSCGRVWLHSSHAAQGTSVFIRQDGGAPGSLLLTDNDLSAAKMGVDPAIP